MKEILSIKSYEIRQKNFIEVCIHRLPAGNCFKPVIDVCVNVPGYYTPHADISLMELRIKRKHWGKFIGINKRAHTTIFYYQLKKIA